MSIIINKFLIEALALALAASQIFVDKGVRTSFNIERDKAEVMEVLKSGCGIMRQQIYEMAPAFQLVDPVKFFDDQIKFAEKNGRSTEVFRGLRLQDLKVAYQVFCTGEIPAHAQVLLEEVIFFYNATLQELPEFDWLKGHQLATYSSIQDSQGRHIKDVFRQSRRLNLPLSKIPDLVKYAFLAAEDQNFYDTNVHRGVDRKGLARAGFSTLTSTDKKSQGGSTITQQLVKNLLLSSENSFERKLREMVLAYQIEKLLSKDEILELYVNYVYFGRQAWGVQMAAHSWFGRSLEQLSIAEIAFLAGLPKGPKLLSPEINPEKSRERSTYVLGQMAHASVSRLKPNGKAGELIAGPLISEEELKKALAELESLNLAKFDLPMPTAGYHFFDELILSSRKDLNINPLRENVKITSTINLPMQQRVEGALQEGLAQFELGRKKIKFSGAEGNLSAQIAKLKANGGAAANLPLWQVALQAKRPPLVDVHWPLAVVLNTPAPKSAIQVGLADGRIVNLQSKISANLNQYDLVYVKIRPNGEAELRFRPSVQGAVVVMENSGRIVSMVGGFSYELSQLNRAAHMIRSPGSTAKVATYLTAFQHYLSPNTLFSDSSVTLQLPGDKQWSPKGASGGIVTLRNGLENSRNLVPVQIMTKLNNDPQRSLQEILAVMGDCGLVQNPKPHYPAILGGGIDARVIDVATCYASVANGGYRPKPTYIDRVEQDGRLLYQAEHQPVQMSLVDRESAFQMRRLLQGVVVRGTAKSLGDDLRDLSGKLSIGEFIGGKTGTSQEGLDAWFVGFTSDLTIAVWIGYDNETAETRETLGDEITAAQVAVPIWREVLRATLKDYPLKPLPPPPAGVRLVEVQTQLSGKVVDKGISEYHRVGANGQVINTWTRYHTWPEPPVVVPYYNPYYYYPYYRY